MRAALLAARALAPKAAMQMLMTPGQLIPTTQDNPMQLHASINTLGGGASVKIAKPAVGIQSSDCRMSAARFGSAGFIKREARRMLSAVCRLDRSQVEMTAMAVRTSAYAKSNDS